MKILRISLRNIASLAGTHTVDFTREPLRSAGLFSISGPTGSGKSTLLDALCLALYQRTPRLHLVTGAANLSDSGREITQKDPANLLRRGTAEGFAEVAFVGVDQGIYTARWSLRRAHNRTEGAFQKSEMVLLRGDIRYGSEGAIEQGGRKTEVLPVIAEKVGLSYEQFTRAVMLAQNDFATFLKADDRDRAEILQALTGTERFEGISMGVYARCATAMEAVKEVQSRLAGSAPLDSVARASAESARSNAEAEWKAAQEKLSAREAQAEWFKKTAELADALAAGEAALVVALGKWDSAVPRRLALEQATEMARDAKSIRTDEQRAAHDLAAAGEKRGQMEKEDAAAQAALVAKNIAREEARKALDGVTAASKEAAPKLLAAGALEAQLPSLVARLGATLSEQQAAEAHLEQARKTRDARAIEIKTAEDEIVAIAARRAGLEVFAPFAADAKAWLDRLDRVAAARASFLKAQRELAKKVEGEREKSAVALAERNKASQLQAERDAAASLLETAEVAVGAYDGEKIAANRQSATEASGALRELQTQLHDLTALRTQCTGFTAEIARLKAEQEADERRLADIKQRQIPSAEASLEAARLSYELAEAAVSEAAVAFREKLSPEQPCPVCGAREHPYSQHLPTTEGAALRALKSFRQQREKELGVLCNLDATLTANRGSRGSVILEKSSTLTELAPRLEKASTIRHSHPAAAAVLLLPEEERASVLEGGIRAEDAKIKATLEDDIARRKVEKEREDRRAARDKAAEALSAQERNNGQHDVWLATLKAAREAAESARTDAETAYAAASTQIEPLLAEIAGLLPSLEHEAAKFRGAFERQTAEWIAMESRRRELSSITEKYAATLSLVEDALRRAVADFQSKQAAASAARQEHDTVRAQRDALFSGRAVAEVAGELEAAGKRAAEDFEKFTRELQRAETERATSAEALRCADAALKERGARHVEAAGVVDAWMCAFSPRNSRVLDRAGLDAVLARGEAWFATERAALAALEKEMENARGALDVHKHSLEAHSATRLTTDEETRVAADLVTLREVLAVAEKLRDEARATVIADDQQRVSSFTLAAELEARRLSSQPWERLNELIGSADGAKFRNIAQRRTLDILLGYANVQLDLLATRYRLERISESLNLIVVDRDMGDERRSVHSLSGGESFLVSLALALGLASLTSSRLRIESLFIDEGFGSLDPDTLNTAMSALMHLEGQGRKVGVISHVSEMADTIPVQIRVIKGRSGASRIVVPGAEEETSPPGGAVAGAVGAEQRTENAERVGAEILRILRREEAIGKAKVSLRALRKEIGCGEEEFTAARECLGAQIHADGRSLIIASDPVKT